MGYNPNMHNRRSYRLKGYDYNQAGLYFITICVKNMECTFGEIVNSEMVLNKIGRIADECWLEIPKHFPKILLYEYSIMPNHMHDILHLKQDGCVPNKKIGNSLVGTSHVMSLQDDPNKNSGNNVVSHPDKLFPLEYTLFTPIPGIDFSTNNQRKFSNPLPESVSVIIQQYKASVKRNCNKSNEYEFNWQSRFYDHVIKDEQSYLRIADYIKSNPKNWKDDKYYKK
jgi:REP element-mobilizing transposase RayT